MTQYRYRPAGNRTPVMHPTFGHLVWDQVVNNPACAGDPDFEAIEASDTDPGETSGDTDQGPDAGTQAPVPAVAGTDTIVDPTAPAEGETAADESSVDDPATTWLGAGKPGRSK